MSKYYDDYGDYDDFYDLKQTLRDISEKTTALIYEENLKRITEEKALHLAYRKSPSLRKQADSGFYEEDDSYWIEEVFEHEMSTIRNQAKDSYKKKPLGGTKNLPQTEITQVEPVNQVVSSASSVKLNSWRHWPRWVSLGTVTAGTLAVVPGLITMNLMSIAITGGCLLATAAVTAWGWIRGKNTQAYEDTALWKSMAAKWGEQSLPEGKAELLDSAKAQKPAEWHESDKTYTLVYNSETQTYELNQAKRQFDEGEEIEISLQMELWETCLDEKAIPEKALSCVKSLQATLKRLPTAKLDALAQHQIQRIMRDSIEALDIYGSLSEYKNADDNNENLQIVLSILNDLGEEAVSLIETEIAKLRNQLEAHALYVANRTKEEN